MTKTFRKKQPMTPTFFAYCEYDKISEIKQ